MPGGVQTLQSLFPEEYIKQFSVKYVDWAPAPFDKLPTPVAEMGLFNMGSMQRDSPAPIIRVMHVISGIDRMFSKLSVNPAQDMELSAKAMRSRVRLYSVLWYGILADSVSCGGECLQYPMLFGPPRNWTKRRISRKQ